MENHTLLMKLLLPLQLGAIRTKKIFVGGLKPETTEESLREYFGHFGTVSCPLLSFSIAYFLCHFHIEF